MRYRKASVAGTEYYAHRIVCERALGRELPASAVIHHVDENKLNNANSNLVICQDRAYHMLLHQRMRVVKAGGNPNTDRYCGTCKQVKPAEMFYMRSSGKRITACRKCNVRKRVEWLRARGRHAEVQPMPMQAGPN